MRRLLILEAEAGEEVIVGDVRSLEDARRAMAGCDAVVHLAGIQPPSAKWGGRVAWNKRLKRAE